MEREIGGGLFTGLLVGTVIGVSLGLLYAPRLGWETRAMLRQQADDIRDRTGEFGDDIMTKAEEFGGMVRERINELTHAVKGDGAEKASHGGNEEVTSRD